MTNEHLRKSRGKNDECYTPKYGVEPLLEFLPRFKDKIIWCPFDTEESEFVKTFTERGYKVIYSHIDNGQDFYTHEPEKWDIIISNPPFSGKTKIFERAISFNKPFALLMNIAYLNDGVAAKTFKDIRLQLLSFNQRIEFKQRSAKNVRIINFLSAYFCRDFLPDSGILFRDLKNSYSANQKKLFKED